MKRSKFKEFYELFLSNPDLDRWELAERVGVSRDTVDVYMKRYRDRGMIEEKDDGEVIFHVKEDSNSFKRDVYEMMVDEYIRDFKKAEFYTERVEIGKIILRLMERL